MNLYFTYKCTGDLGLSTSSGEVVALIFERKIKDDELAYAIFNVMKGGEPRLFEGPAFPDALNYMIQIGEEWLRTRSGGDKAPETFPASPPTK